MSQNLHKLGDTLRDLRRQRGFTQEQLAELANLHSTYIAKIETGQRLPSLSTLASIANALEVRVAVLIDGPESEAKDSIFHDAMSEPLPQDLERVKREISYMLQGLNLKQTLLLKDIIRAIKTYADNEIL